MHADVQPAMQPERQFAAHTRVTLLFVSIVFLTLAILWPVTRSMIQVWQSSSTYGHCYLVIPVAAWMVWRESATLVGVTPVPFWPGLALIAAIGCIGLLGELANVAVVTQFAAIGAAVAAVLTVLGWHWSRELAFPLGFLFFAVPFGEEWLPVLMQWTADVTVAALRATGIPVYREGTFFVIPSGSWSIVEACGGVRFLIAALMMGCIFAWLQYRSALTRIMFVALAAAAALLANWLRAYAIVLMGHLSDNRIGSGDDHQWWGWLIFGAVMFALFAVGMRWSDQRADHRSVTVQTGTMRRISLSVLTALVASTLAVAAWPAAAAWIELRTGEARPVQIEPIVPQAGWKAVANAEGDWAPELVAPAAQSVQTFVLDGSTVGVFRGVYRSQKQGSELVSAMNKVVRSESRRWRLLDTGTLQIGLNGKPVAVKTAVVRGANAQFLIWHWYWFAGHASSSDVGVNIRLALQRLTGGDDTAAWVAVYTPVGDDSGTGARVLSSFVETMSRPLNAALEATANR